MNSLSFHPPTHYGAPRKFSSWRPNQTAIIEHILTSPHRIVPISAPVGSGKSLAYVMSALIGEQRTAILTATKGLQDQIQADFAEIGVADIRGKGNYQCRELKGCSCKEAAPRCSLAAVKGGGAEGREGREGAGLLSRRQPKPGCGCTYKEAYNIASCAQIVSTNYAYWMTMQKITRTAKGRSGTKSGVEALTAPGTPRFDMLILDEAHSADKELSGFLHQEIHASLSQEIVGEGMEFFDGVDENSPVVRWRAWATSRASALNTDLDYLRKHSDSKEALQKLSRGEELLSVLEEVKRMPDDGWVVDRIESWRHPGKVLGYQFDPVWPGAYAEAALFCGVGKVVLLSGTIVPKTMGLLGVGSGDYKMKQYPFTFPRERCPCYWVRGIRLNHKTSHADKLRWVRLIDRIIEGRLDRKGIVHTPSFQLQRFFLEHSRHKRLLLYNDPGSWDHRLRTARVVEEFKRAEAPRVLVSPSISTGYDFAGDAAEYQVIGKLPFPDMTSKAMKARKDRDPQYAGYLAAMGLVQSWGRIMRGERDSAETFIVDGNLGWFLQQNRALLPSYFQVRWVEGVEGVEGDAETAELPPPPKKLVAGAV